MDYPACGGLSKTGNLSPRGERDHILAIYRRVNASTEDGQGKEGSRKKETQQV
jgi:hypothetical protein